jgi:hypothetical protein
MNKILFITFCLPFLLAGCSKETSRYGNFSQAKAALEQLNIVLNNSESNNQNKEIGTSALFSDKYLRQRHEIYQSLMNMTLTPGQRAQVNYLVIAERFPERYFAWPAQINVLKNIQLFASSNKDILTIKWLQSTLSKLKDAHQSKLKLNKIELSLIKGYLAKFKVTDEHSTELSSVFNELVDYLLVYKPRGSIGLSGLANGSEWYQSKLNYFSGEVHSPLEWVTLLNNEIKKLEPQPLNITLQSSHQQSFIVHYLAKEQAIDGLDWLTNYQLLPEMAQQTLLTNPSKTLMLALMETDVGVHYHAWTLPQAKVNLMKRLTLTEQQAKYLVEDIALYPAQSFSFAKKLVFN